MEWTRSNTLGLSKPSCTKCKGTGMRGVNEDMPCFCVGRAIFRACYAKVREITEYRVAWYSSLANMGTGSPAINYPGSGRRKGEEFIADFCLIAKRVLTEAEHQIFRFHFILRADWKICCRRLKIERGAFFHAVYRIEATVGRALAETRPYPVFPIDEYYARVLRNGLPVEIRPTPVFEHRRNGIPLRPPLAKRSTPFVIRAPEPVATAPISAAFAFDITNPAAVADYIRSRFRAGASIRSIGLEMERLNVPTQHGRWGSIAVRRVLLDKAA